MAILNFDHLFEQADRLTVPQGAGAPRQVDLRRAISAAYYGLFHFVLTRIADEFVGVTQGWDASLRFFAATAIDLQEKRHGVDYDSKLRIETSDARLAIRTARKAVIRFQAAAKEERKAFLALLVCPPR